MCAGHTASLKYTLDGSRHLEANPISPSPIMEVHRGKYALFLFSFFLGIYAFLQLSILMPSLRK